MFTTMLIACDAMATLMTKIRSVRNLAKFNLYHFLTTIVFHELCIILRSLNVLLLLFTDAAYQYPVKGIIKFAVLHCVVLG